MPVEMYQVTSAINSAVAPIHRSIHQHEAQLNAIEAEMANIERAVTHMGATLATKLDHIGHGQREMVNVQQSTMLMTLEQFTAANSQLGGIRNVSENGFRGVSSNLTVVDGSVRQMSAAMVQMEVIRLLNAAKRPVQQIFRFSQEIDQRFAKAVENVFFVRCQYDQVLGTAMEEYDKKLRLIGEHIYRIHDEDFCAFAEAPLSITSQVFAELPLAVESRRLEARRDALETDLETLDDEALQPLLEMHREFEHAMASRYGSSVELADGEVHVPVAVRIIQGKDGFDVEAFAGAELQKGLWAAEPQPSLDGGRELAASVAAVIRSRGDAVPVRRLSPAEVAALKNSLADLANEGMFDPALLPGYFDYLDAFGLEEVADGELLLDRRMA